MARSPHLVVLALGAVLGCDTVFNPKGPFQEQLVVYAVLSTETDTTFARVYRTYDPPGFDPTEVTQDQPVTDAVVRLTGNGSEWVFRDTLVPRDDTTRYQGPIWAYALTGISVVPGTEYRLDIQSPTAGSADAVVTVPTLGQFTVQNSFILQDPTFTTDNVTVTATILSATWGYEVRLFLVGEVWEGGTWRLFTREVPTSVIEVISCEVASAEFPRLQRRETSNAYEEHILLFENLAYRWAIASIRSGHSVDSVRFLRAEFEFLETDLHLYSYYNIVSGFRDEFTVRTDEPDYSNIRGGRGVFGAFVRQRFSYPVPPTLGSSLTCD